MGTDGILPKTIPPNAVIVPGFGRQPAFVLAADQLLEAVGHAQVQQTGGGDAF